MLYSAQMEDRQLFKRGFSINSVPHWPCPKCGAPISLVKESFSKFETAESKRNSRDGEWGPECIELHFIATFRCSSTHCYEKFVVCGSGSAEPDYHQDEDGNYCQAWEEFFVPDFFTPPLHLFKISADVPEEVRTEVIASFRLFFCDTDAAGNHLRCSVEFLLDHLRVPRARNHKTKRKRIRLPLQARIESLPLRFSETKERLSALRWLGNTGSHSGISLTQDDVLDGYVIMEDILREIFTPSEAKDIAKRINKQKGPQKKRVKTTRAKRSKP